MPSADELFFLALRHFQSLGCRCREVEIEICGGSTGHPKIHSSQHSDPHCPAPRIMASRMN